MSTREIVTLQIGHYANCVGTHWWNLQEAGFNYDPQSAADSPSQINHDVLFREGKNLTGDVTYTPRLVSVDLKGSLKCLKQQGTLYDLPASLLPPQCNGPDVSVHQTAPIPKNEFLSDLDRQEDAILHGRDPMEGTVEGTVEQSNEEAAQASSDTRSPQVFGKKFYDLDDSVAVWSDYLRIHLHPKSITLLPSYHHDSTEEPFDVYTYGSASLAEGDTLTDIEDRLHFFTEECDSLQGIHTIVDSYNGFGCVGSQLLETLTDDLSGKSFMTFSVFPSVSHDSSKQPDLNYHTSAILAAALDTTTLPYRLKCPSISLSNITNTFSTHSRKVASLAGCLPLPLSHNASLMDILLQYETRVPWQPLTPYMDCETIPSHQSVVVRGCIQEPSNVPTPQLPQPCRSNSEVLQLYLTESYPSSLNGGCVVKDTCAVTSPYPHIFSTKINKDGYLTTHDRPTLQGVREVSLMTSLQSSPSTSHLLHHLHSRSSNANIRKHHHFLSSTFEEDDFREAMDRLETLADNYDD